MGKDFVPFFRGNLLNFSNDLCAQLVFFELVSDFHFWDCISKTFFSMTKVLFGFNMCIWGC